MGEEAGGPVNITAPESPVSNLDDLIALFADEQDDGNDHQRQ